MKKLFKLMFALLLTLNFTASVLPAATVYAEDEDEETTVVRPDIPVPDFLPTPNTGGSGDDTQNYILNKTIPQAINLVIGILGIATFAGILFASLQFLTAYGDDTKLTRAKTNLRYGIFGFLISILAYGIVSIVVSIALPNETDQDANTGFHFIQTAYAIDTYDDLEILLPNQQDIIEEQDDQGRVALPGGDFLGEIVPAIITNVMYMVGFLIFIAFVYGGTLLVINRGNEETVTKAKQILIYSSVALALVSLGYAIVSGIANLNLNADEDSSTDDVFDNIESEQND
jgi:hypothetical protein